jgi:acyl-coenzyme A synthetase/AMP-(fatty) acid ligase
MKRAVICVENPQDYIEQLNDYSLMIVNPNSSQSRLTYLFDRSDYSLKITSNGYEYRDGGEYPNERVFWYTSGTTGDSKFCSFTQEQLDQMAQTICDTYEITSSDRYVSVMPLWHAHGQGFYWATQLAGCKTNFLSMANIRNIQNLDPTFITAVPDVLNILLNFDFKNLRFIRSASAPLPDQLYQKLKTKFGVPVIEAFGMTEALSHCFTNPLHGEQRIGTIGFPSGIDAKIIDSELHIQGPCVFKSGWYNTGDLAIQDSDGYYKILGRLRDQINVRGIKLNPISLEKQTLANVPGLEQCVIFGKDEVKCVYVGSCTELQIKKFLQELGASCYPRLVVKVNEIPLGTSGKISRAYLESLY